MADIEKVIEGLEQHMKMSCLSRIEQLQPIFCPYLRDGDCIINMCRDALEILKEQKPITGETSDGYHTFNELYHHRAVLFSVIVANYPERAWKAKKHHDGTMYDGMFIVGIETPDGQATYHYDINPYWDMFDCKVFEFAPEWDGHTPAQAIERIGRLALLKEHEARVLTLEEVRERKPFHLWVEDFETGAQVFPVAYVGGLYVDSAEDWSVDPDHRNTPEYYGKSWRFWTARPTNEQRKKVKWND